MLAGEQGGRGAGPRSRGLSGLGLRQTEGANETDSAKALPHSLKPGPWGGGSIASLSSSCPQKKDPRSHPTRGWKPAACLGQIRPRLAGQFYDQAQPYWFASGSHSKPRQLDVQRHFPGPGVAGRAGSEHHPHHLPAHPIPQQFGVYLKNGRQNGVFQLPCLLFGAATGGKTKKTNPEIILTSPSAVLRHSDAAVTRFVCILF